MSLGAVILMYSTLKGLIIVTGLSMQFARVHSKCAQGMCFFETLVMIKVVN